MKKKAIIIGAVIFLVLAIGVGSYFIFFNKDDNKTNNKDEKITITFDSDGGTKVEDMKVKKGSSFQLPETTKEGYTFAGWYNGSTLYTDDDTASIKKNIVLTAKWEEKDSEKKYIKITYDSKGGSKVSADEFECVNDSYTIESFPKNPTKDGYTFRAWEDKHGKAILTGAKLTCENITLYAAWDKAEQTTLKVTFDSKGGSKVKDMSFKCTDGAATIKNLPKPTKELYNFMSWEDKHGKSILDGAKIVCEGKETTLKLYAIWDYDGPVANPEQNNDPVTPKEPKCPDGFEKTSDNKCVSKKSPEYYCDEGYKNSTVDNTVCYKYLKEPDVVTCKDGKYHYTQSSSNGSKIHFCATELASYTGNLTGCQGAGGQLLSNNHCVKNVEQVGNSKLNFTCYSSVYRDGSALASGEKDGCYELKQRTYGCKNAGDGYSMNHTIGKCVKTINPE